MALKTLSQIRSQLELMLSLGANDSYSGSATELGDINQAYEATAYAYDFPHLLSRIGIAITANVNRYTLPTNFRKARTVKVLGIEYKEVELDVLYRSRYAYAIDRENNEIILSTPPSTTSTAYTLSNAEVAGSATVIELNSVTGISQWDEIWINSVAGTDEFSLVSAVSTSPVNITARLRANKSAGDVVNRVLEIIDIQYYRLITLLAGTSDVTLLPDVTDFIIPHYAAALAYERMEEFDRYQTQMKVWQDRLNLAWLALDKNATGPVGQFTI